MQLLTLLPQPAHVRLKYTLAILRSSTPPNIRYNHQSYLSYLYQNAEKLNMYPHYIHRNMRDNTLDQWQYNLQDVRKNQPSPVLNISKERGAGVLVSKAYMETREDNTRLKTPATDCCNSLLELIHHSR